MIRSLRKITVVCALLLAGSALAQHGSPAEFKSIYAAQDVTLNTDPGSPFWQKAVPIVLATDNQGNPVAHSRTEVRSRWTDKNLYLLFVSTYQVLNLKPEPKTDVETNQLWNWDVAEAFIGSDLKNIRRYKEFEISPQREWIDLDVNLDIPHHENGWIWNSGFQTAARIDSKHKIWYGAMRIPMASIQSGTPHAGEMLRANFYRTEGAAPHTQELAWQPTMNVTFHVPERFGRIVLTR